MELQNLQNCLLVFLIFFVLKSHFYELDTNSLELRFEFLLIHLQNSVRFVGVNSVWNNNCFAINENWFF